MQSWVNVLRDIQDDVHACAVNHGFWDHSFWENECNFGEKIALIHSELSEALEAGRHGMNTADDMLPEFTAVEVELADAIIRILDLGAGLKLKIPEALVAKNRYNSTRPYRHGKEF